ncbi:MAG TPA: DNA translocase FtsK 4TM domain-containing protein [Candidatus Paceibacterota bacterium]|nr:DNA translocase FtsK 4TM domain-containing protein [Candidatus Paceibacterota bacterium]HRU21041.1 DNA translocase FtsK 4TM domain-containing protein [Candidatus Paceibacterota bacterium]
MAKRRPGRPKIRHKKNEKIETPHKSVRPFLSLSEKMQRYIFTVLFFLLAIIILFSFASSAGVIGANLNHLLRLLIGYVIFAAPVIFILIGFVIFQNEESIKSIKNSLLVAGSIFLLGATGIFALGELRVDDSLKNNFIWNHSGPGGWLGYIITWPLCKGFDFWVTFFIFVLAVSISLMFLIEPFWKKRQENKPNEEKLAVEVKNKKTSKELKESATILEKMKKEAKDKLKSLDFKKVDNINSELPALEIKKPQKGFEERKKENLIYKYPPLELLSARTGNSEGGDIELNSAIIKKTLKNFGIDVEMGEVNIGPTVTQYTLKPAEGVKLSKITALQNDLALALASQSIRIEAPIPGRSLVGVEIPNRKRALVSLREVMDNQEFKTSPDPLLMVLGKDVMGRATFADLGEMPHLLIGGTTGSGKTICLNTIIMSLLYRNSPEELKLVLVDPKRVEFPVYASLQHLLCPVIYDAQQTLVALKWLVGEMERRFTVLSEAHSRDIGSYNLKQEKKGEEKMPYIALIIDELADLMSVKGKEIESYVVRLAQMSRATGIHLILATQRPSVEVITGLIKANITSRIALKVGSLVDSRTILDASGAEKLLGKGDMLIMSKEYSKPKRIQSPYVSEIEIKKVVTWLKENNPIEEIGEEEGEGNYLEIQNQNSNSLAGELQKAMETPEAQMDSFYSKEDPLFEEAKRTVIAARKASASLLQRRLGIGYARAARLIDILEERGIVGPADGAKPRDVLVGDETDDNDY